MITHQDYKHIIPVQIRFCDIDKLNHVNNACYHNYVELGRVNYFNQLLKGHINWDKQGFVLARTEMNHLLPVHLDDEIFCCSKVIKFGNKSLTIKNSIIRKEKNKISECSAVIGILVATDYVNNVSMVIPEEWKKLITAFEGEVDRQ